jgi:hypothetical protein
VALNLQHQDETMLAPSLVAAFTLASVGIVQPGVARLATSPVPVVQTLDPAGEYELEAAMGDQQLIGGIRIARDGAAFTARLWVNVMPDTLMATRTKFEGRVFTLVVSAPPGDTEITLTYGADGTVSASALWLTGENQGQRGDLTVRRKKA